VGAREAAELKSIFLDAQNKALALFRETLCGAVPTIWDLRGALIFIRWLGPIRPIGKVIVVAELTRRSHCRPGLRARAAQVVRLGDALSRPREAVDSDSVLGPHVSPVADQPLTRRFSLTTKRPCHLLDQENTLTQAKWLVSRPDAKPRDYRLLVSYEFAQIARESRRPSAA
jgi:hypothetical protein